MAVELLVCNLAIIQQKRKKDDLSPRPTPSLSKFNGRCRQPGSGNKAEASYLGLANNKDLMSLLPHTIIIIVQVFWSSRFHFYFLPTHPFIYF